MPKTITSVYITLNRWGEEERHYLEKLKTHPANSRKTKTASEEMETIYMSSIYQPTHLTSRFTQLEAFTCTQKPGNLQPWTV